MQTQEIIQHIATDLQTSIPQWFDEVKPICADAFNDHKILQPISLFCHPIDDDWATCMNIGWLREDQFFYAMEDIIRLNFFQSLAYAYCRMSPTRVDVAFDEVEKKLDECLQNQVITPIIVNFGVDLFLVSNEHGLGYDQKNNKWNYKGIPIYEFPYPANVRYLNRSLVVLSKNEAPFVDYSKQRFIDLSLPGTASILHVYNTNDAEIVTYWGNKGNIDKKYFAVNFLTPILCREKTNAFQIHVSEYEYEREIRENRQKINNY